MSKIEVGCVIKLKASTRKLNKLRYDRKYIVTKMSQDLRDLITQVVDQFANPINLKMDTDYFDIIWYPKGEEKPKRYSIGHKVISTRDTPQVPEGFIGYIVEKPIHSCDDYEYAVEHESSIGKIEYFNEDELELLSANLDNKLTDKEEHTGGSVGYYKVLVSNPTTLDQPYYAEANDIIESLGLTFAEGNLLKAVWRIAADRNGKKKKGNNSVYDAEKLVFFAERVLAQEKSK